MRSVPFVRSGRSTVAATGSGVRLSLLSPAANASAYFFHVAAISGALSWSGVIVFCIRAKSSYSAFDAVGSTSTT